MANLRLLQVPQGYIETLTDEGECWRIESPTKADTECLAVVETINAALVIQFSIACSSYGNHHDDISATMQLFQKDFLKDDSRRVQNFTNAFLNDMYRIVSLDVDYSGDKKTETYLKSGLYQKTLSMQLSLGYWGEQRHRSLSSKLALAILQLRWAALTFAMGFRSHPPGSTSAKEAEAHRAGMHQHSRILCSRLDTDVLQRLFARSTESSLGYFLCGTLSLTKSLLSQLGVSTEFEVLQTTSP